MKRALIAALLAVGVAALSGCAVVPAGSRQVVVRPAPAAVPAAVVEEDEGAPPAEYIVENEPVYYESEPGIAFYPVFVDFPGSCFCIMPVRFVGGVWYAPGHVMVHQGHWGFHRPGPNHLNAWRSAGGHYGGHAPVHGRFERGPGGRMHAVPPAGVHQQHFQRQQMERQQRAPAAQPNAQHATPPQARPPQPPNAQSGTVTAPHAPRPAPPQARPPQARPAPPAARPQPRPAPAKKCAPNQQRC